MPKKKELVVRISTDRKQQLKEISNQRQVSMSDIIREQVRNLLKQNQLPTI